MLESDEQVQLTEQVRNAGTPTPPGSLGGADAGGSGLTVTQGSSAYPDLAADAARPNSTPFAVHLANAATCGADVPATLNDRLGAGTQAIPLALPTGRAGRAADRLGGDRARRSAIPDDSATGVSSSVFVAERGRIKDLDVAIPARRRASTTAGSATS